MSISSRKTILMKWSAYLACHVMLENSSWSASSIGMEWRLEHCGVWCSSHTKRHGKCNRRRPKESINITGQWKAKLTEVRHKVSEKGSCIVERGQSSGLGWSYLLRKRAGEWKLDPLILQTSMSQTQKADDPVPWNRCANFDWFLPTPYRSLKAPRHPHLERRTLCWRAGVWSRRSRSTEGRRPRTASRYEDSRPVLSSRAGPGIVNPGEVWRSPTRSHSRPVNQNLWGSEIGFPEPQFRIGFWSLVSACLFCFLKLSRWF